MLARHLALPTTAVVLAFLAGCTASDPAAPETPTTPVSGAEIATGDGTLRVGALVPTSGAFAFLGGGIAAGIALAVQDINDAGGVLGAEVEVVTKDSGDASSQTAETSFAALVDAGADVVIGPSSSALVERLLPAIVAAGIPVVSPAATRPELGRLYDADLVFRTVPSHAMQGLALAGLLGEGEAADTVVIASDDDLGREVVATLVPAIERDGGAIETMLVPASRTDHAATIEAVREAAPDAVVVATSYDTESQTKAIIGALVGAGFGGATLWLTTQNAGDYSQTFPAGRLDRVQALIDGVEPDAAFLARLKAVQSGLGSARYAAEAYDAVMLAALAAVIADDHGGSAIAGSLRAVSAGGVKCTTFAECLVALRSSDDIDYDGVSGPIDFDDVGDVSAGRYSLHAYNDENKFEFERHVSVP